MRPNTMPEGADRLVEYDDHVLVHCPRCDQCATVRYLRGGARLTCTHCGNALTMARSRGRFDPSPWGSPSLYHYNTGERPFGASLWLETECYGGNRLWAVNESHLGYIRAFVASTDRTREFPSPPGDRQLADKLPAWLVAAKHRDEVLRALDRLRATL
jgi:hypothetical protein